MLVTFKLENCINDMFQHLGACNAPFFIYMSDKQDRRMSLLCET